MKLDPRKNRFLAEFSPDGREGLVAHLVYQDIPSGDYLFYEGDVADSVVLVLQGEVEVLKTAGKHEEIFGRFQPGDFLGEVGVIDNCGRSTSARAKGDVAIAKIPKDLLLETLNKEPVAMTLRLFQSVLAHLRRTNELFVHEVVRKEKLALVGEMASSLMHDLRNPIAGIHMAADLITMNHTDEETVHCCDKVRLQCDRLVAMASELLEFSRGESKLNLSRTDTTAFLQQFVTLNEDYFRQTGLNFNFEAEPAPIEIDGMRVMRLLQNLVTNAVDALKSQPDGSIEIRSCVQESTLCFSVSDNGPGIPEAVRDRIFEPFVTHGKKGGTGLGMAIALSVVNAHRGTITFETELGQGTRFLVEIPQDTVGGTAAQG